MAFSNQTAVSDGTLQTIILSIAFFDKSEIRVFRDTVEIFTPADYVWATSNSIQFPAPQALGVVIQLRRTTDISEMRHIFTEGAQFTNQTLDEDYTQILHIAQEAAEGGNLSDVFNDLDMHQNQVKNMDEATDPDDAVTLGQVQGLISNSDTLLRAIRVPLTDPIIATLPDAASRANKVMGFDSGGNPVATLPGSGTADELALDLLNPAIGTNIIGYDTSTLADFLTRLRSPTGTANGVSLAGRGVRWFDTITELRTSVAGVAGVCYVAETGRAGFFKVDPAVVVDNNITQYVSSSGVGFRRMYDGPINVMWAGAKCDKVTDDTAAIQQVIDYCATFTDWPAIEVPGPSLLLGSLVVDREVIAHTDRAEWRVYGTGGTGGFHRVDASTTMFSSTLPMVNDPLSAWLTFVDMRFTCPDRNLNATILSKNFLQMKFINCYFLRVRMGTTDKYWQTFNFDHCNFRYTCAGFLHSSNTGYDIHYVGCVSEYGGGYLNVFAQHLYAFSYIGGLHEGALGGLLLANGVEGVLVDGVYFEFNDAPSIDLRGAATNKSVQIAGSFFATSPAHTGDANFYEIMWGTTTGAVSSANTHNNGRLHDNSGMSIAGLDSHGDTAAVTLFKSPLLVTRSSGTWTPVAVGGAVTVSSATYAREGNLMHVAFIFVFPAGGAGVGCTISGLPLPATSPMISGDVGYADLAGEVVLLGGTAAPNSTSSSFNINKDKQGLRYTYNELNGVQVAGAFTYRI